MNAIDNSPHTDTATECTAPNAPDPVSNRKRTNVASPATPSACLLTLVPAAAVQSAGHAALQDTARTRRGRPHLTPQRRAKTRETAQTLWTRTPFRLQQRAGLGTV